MKLKGIGALERNVDKIVLGFSGLALAGALAWTLFLQKPTIKVNNAELSPANAYQPAEDAAKVLLTKIEASDPELPAIAQPSFGSGLRLGKTYAAPERGKIVPLGRTPGIKTGTIVAPGASGNFAAVDIGAIKSVLVGMNHSTISPAEVVRTPGLAALVPAQQPFDKASVTLEGVFDGTALKKALENDPDGDGPLTVIPISWWRDGGATGPATVVLLGMEVERELLRNADGTTPAKPETVMVPVAAGREDGIAMWKERVKSAGDVPVVLEEFRQLEDAVTRPAYFETIAGPDWTPPSEVEVDLTKLSSTDPKARKKAELANFDKRIKSIQGQLAKMGEGDQEGGRGGPRGGGGLGSPRRGGGGPVRGGGGGGEGGGERPEAKDANTLRAEGLKKELENVTKRRERVVSDLAKLGEKVADPAPAAGKPVEEPGLLESPAYRLWAHDMTGVPGATYRYRVRAVTNNPLFGRGLQGPAAKLSESPVMEGPWSGWTQPVTIEAPEYFFVTSATDNDPTLGNRPRISTEMFKFYYGYYRSASASLEPGDRVEGDASLPELMTADMDKLRKQIEEGKSPDLTIFAPKEPEKGQPAVAVSPDAVMVTRTPKRIALAVPSVLLDVRSLPGNTVTGASRFEAVMLASNGAILTESPEGVRNRDDYKRIDASVKAGKEQGKVEETPEETPAPVPSPRRDKQEAPKPPGGGGGGGGG